MASPSRRRCRPRFQRQIERGRRVGHGRQLRRSRWVECGLNLKSAGGGFFVAWPGTNLAEQEPDVLKLGRSRQIIAKLRHRHVGFGKSGYSSAHDIRRRDIGQRIEMGSAFPIRACGFFLVKRGCDGVRRLRMRDRLNANGTSARRAGRKLRFVKYRQNAARWNPARWPAISPGRDRRDFHVRLSSAGRLVRRSGWLDRKYASLRYAPHDVFQRLLC